MKGLKNNPEFVRYTNDIAESLEMINWCLNGKSPNVKLYIEDLLTSCAKLFEIIGKTEGEKRYQIKDTFDELKMWTNILKELKAIPNDNRSRNHTNYLMEVSQRVEECKSMVEYLAI